jgi:hypothetical protein
MHLYKTKGRKYILSSSKIRQADCLAIIDHATDSQAKAMAAAPELLEALELAGGFPWVHNAAITNDIEALRAICLSYGAWWNHKAMPAIAKAKGK